jgi:hypothetical protein
MKERPILFTGAMVRAIRAGRKSQTRRLVKGTALEWLEDVGFTPGFVADEGNAGLHPCRPGDRYWVKENYRLAADHDGDRPGSVAPGSRIWYAADERADPARGKLRPSIFLPRWGSRITLEVAALRLERLKDISEADAIAEGLIWRPALEAWCASESPNWPTFRSPVRSYAGLWNHINPKRGWDSNPWVWAISFEPVACA